MSHEVLQTNPHDQSSGGSKPRLSTTTFLGLQVVLLGGFLGFGFARFEALEAELALPTIRQKPLEIRPLYDDPSVVSDQQLRRVLRRIGVVYRGAETSIGHVDHVFRMWGPTPQPPSKGLMSGLQMRTLLTDQRELALTYGDEVNPLLIDDGRGVRVRAFEGVASSPHVDHTLASLAEVGTWSDFPITTSIRRTTLSDMLEQSLRDFHLDQQEYEWSAAAYALFLPPVNRWRSADGQEVTFDRLAGRLMREELPSGVCAGNHRLHSLVLILRADDQMMAEGAARLLSEGRRSEVVSFLREVTDRYVRHQHEQGFWNWDWPRSKPTSVEATDVEGDRLSDRLIVTGHVLEWWSLAPEQVQPPRPVVARAGQWLVSVVDRLDENQIQAFGSYLSHAGRGLALWRGLLPAEVALAEEGLASDTGAED